MTLPRIYQRVIVAGTAISLSASMTSCVNPSLQNAQGNAVGAIRQSGGTAQDQQKFMADQKKTVGQGTVGGAILGGLAGAALQRQFGIAGVIGGAALGGLIGNQVGQGVAKKKANAEVVDSSLDGAIRDAIAANRSARRSVDSLRGQLAGLKQRANKAKANGDQQELNRIRNQLKTLDGNYLSQQKQIEGQISTQQNLAKQMGSSHAKYSEISSGVTSQQQLRAQVESDRREIASLMNSF